MKGGCDNVAIIRIGKRLQRRLKMLMPFDHRLGECAHHILAFLSRRSFGIIAPVTQDISHEPSLELV